MDVATIIRTITDTFPGIQTVETEDGTVFFFYGGERMFPIYTLVTSDAHDQASALSRPGVFRLNIGLGKATYQSLFGPPPARPGASGVVETGHDFTALDQLMPHPVYAMMFWACILNPSEATFRKTVQPLLTEAYEKAASK